MSSQVRSLAGRSFRSNPRLESVPIDRLSKHEQASLRSFATGREFYGVLRAKGTANDVMAIDHDTALLFHALADSGGVPEHLTKIPAEERDKALARLVCDRVLQIERYDRSFVDGLDAQPELFVDNAQARPAFADHHLGRKSRAAIEYGARVRSVSESSLVRRLYQFNSEPRTSTWEARLPTQAAISRWLGLSSRAKWRVGFRKAYAQHRLDPERDPWLRWYHRGGVNEARHKIYLSPPARELPVVFRRIVQVCCALGVPAFKVGCDLQGVLRPDKLVLYFRGEDELWSAARELALVLDGIAAQGVPFSAPIDGTGLISWGMDPSANTAVGFRGGCSLRTFIVDRLASALKRAPAAGADRLVEFALQRIRLEGIEPDGWHPAPGW